MKIVLYVQWVELRCSQGTETPFVIWNIKCHFRGFKSHRTARGEGKYIIQF